MTRNNKGRNGGDRATPKTTDTRNHTVLNTKRGASLTVSGDLRPAAEVIPFPGFVAGEEGRHHA